MFLKIYQVLNATIPDLLLKLCTTFQMTNLQSYWQSETMKSATANEAVSKPTQLQVNRLQSRKQNGGSLLYCKRVHWC